MALYVNCCDNDINIGWFNRLGGWQNYIFSGVKTFEVQIDDTKTFKSFERVKKFSEITGVYEGEIVTTGNIPKAHADYLDSLRYSIQAYVYNEETSAWDLPILVDVESWVKYSSRDKLFDVRIRFIYATEKIIQSQ
jgi:hypothetical protein